MKITGTCPHCGLLVDDADGRLMVRSSDPPRPPTDSQIASLDAGVCPQCGGEFPPAEVSGPFGLTAERDLWRDRCEAARKEWERDAADAAGRG